jgi:hypothetical protein
LILFVLVLTIWMLIVLVILMPGGYGVATGGPLAWGLCYNHEMSPAQTYCDDYYKVDYPCTPGAEYYGRGAIPIYWYVYCLLALNTDNRSPFFLLFFFGQKVA